MRGSLFLNPDQALIAPAKSAALARVVRLLALEQPDRLSNPSFELVRKRLRLG
jgi:hypothetical protein